MFSFVATIAALLAADPSSDESISVIVVGTLRTGIVAIGGVFGDN